MKEFNLSSNRVFGIIGNTEFEKEKFGNVHLDKIDGEIEFTDVKFGYDEKKYLLNYLLW